MTDTVRTKLCYEELLDKFKATAKQWLTETPEARGLALVVDWKIGQNDFPAGTVVHTNINEQTTLDLMRQSLKMLSSLVTTFEQKINDVNSTLNQAKVLIESQKVISKPPVDSGG